MRATIAVAALTLAGCAGEAEGASNRAYASCQESVRDLLPTGPSAEFHPFNAADTDPSVVANEIGENQHEVLAMFAAQNVAGATMNHTMICSATVWPDSARVDSLFVYSAGEPGSPLVEFTRKEAR